MKQTTVYCLRTFVLFVLVAMSAQPVAAEEVWEVLGKAAPDECFYYIGADNQYPLDSTCDNGTLKRNEAYVWGLAKHGDNTFFGTGPNVHCLVINGYLGQSDPIITDDYVCEAAANPPYGDMRPPGMYMYNSTTGLVSLIGGLGPAEGLRLQTLGIRSAGAHNGVAFLAGPGVSGINMFAFDAATGMLLGATNMSEYSNVRKWLVVDNQLYVGVGGMDGGSGGTGAVLRWTGTYSADPNTLFAFEVVGEGMDNIVAELTEHDGRIMVTTWPAFGSSVAGVWMSPPIAEVAPGNTSWTKIWSATDYDPDPVTAGTYGGGAIASFDGWVYWGTMHVPGLSAIGHQRVYYPDPSNQPTQEQMLQILVGTWRAISIFRGRNFGTAGQEIELLYGGSNLESMPAGFLQAWDNSTKTWRPAPNKMGPPKYGRGGFGNLFNNYCWTMRVGMGSLYVGTMDHGYLIAGQADIPPVIAAVLQEATGYQYGADLYRFNNSQSRAKPVSLDGMGNELNYGIRTMLCDEESCTLGTANPMNLNEDGGWELIEMTWDINTDGTSPLTCEDYGFENTSQPYGPGFGDPWNKYPWSMHDFNGHMYVGTNNVHFDLNELQNIDPGSLEPGNPFGIFQQLNPQSEGARIWRYDYNNMYWQMVYGNSLDQISGGFRKMIEYDGKLYASSVDYTGVAELLVTADGTNWTKITDGPGIPGVPFLQQPDPDNASKMIDVPNTNWSFRSLEVYNDLLYVGTDNFSGAELWTYDPDNATVWQRVMKFPPNTSVVTELAVFDDGTGDKLYAGTQTQPRFEVHAFDAGGYAGNVSPPAVVDGHNLEVLSNMGVAKLYAFDGKLMVGTANFVEGFTLLVYDGESWQLISADGFGNRYNTYTWAMADNNGLLYMGTFTSDFLSGLSGGGISTMDFNFSQPELWASANGTDWFQLNLPSVDCGWGMWDYGIRNMEIGNNWLFIGSASNLFAPDAEETLRLLFDPDIADGIELIIDILPGNIGGQALHRALGPGTEIWAYDFDNDNDGVQDGEDNCPAVPNVQADVDNDTVGNACDNCPTVANTDQKDTDEDSLGDSCDNCPLIANPDQANLDGDDQGGDVCDPDDDNDGTPDVDDNCPRIANADQADNDTDMRGDVCDNCPFTANTDQSDNDRDAEGDACDDDDDNDGILDVDDNCPFTINPSQKDTDDDGVGGACDNCILLYNPDQNDNDDDGIGDACDDDDDNDQLQDGDDNCPLNYNPSQSDFDGDGTGDACDRCPDDRNKVEPGLCGCGEADSVNCGEGSSGTPGESTPPSFSVPALLDMGTEFSVRYFEVKVSGGSLSWTVGTPSYSDASDPWIVSIDPTVGSSTTDVQVEVSRDGLTAGVHSAEIPVTAGGTTKTITVSIEVTAQLEPPAPAPGCVEDADCNDGLFCNGEELCQSGECVSGVVPCGADQMCMEEQDTCYQTRILPGRIVPSIVFRPFLLERRCRVLALRVNDAGAPTAESSIRIAGTAGEADGISYDDTRNIVKIGSILFVPICIDQDATQGNWTIEIETALDDPENLRVETIAAGFQVW